MTFVFVREIENLKKKMLSLSTQVEENVMRAISALQRRDVALARRVIDLDVEIDRQEVEIEEEGLKILALYQPVAMDLRFLAAVIKINNDLERIGDLAVNMARGALALGDAPGLLSPDPLRAAALQARDMVQNSLSAFVHLDGELAAQVCAADDLLDAHCDGVVQFVEQVAPHHPEQLRDYLILLKAARDIERVGDHATNIAEDVIYLIEGKIVRHNLWRPSADGENVGSGRSFVVPSGTETGSGVKSDEHTAT